MSPNIINGIARGATFRVLGGWAIRDLSIQCNRLAAAAFLWAGLLVGAAGAAEESCAAGTEDVHLGAVVDSVTIALSDGRILRLAGIEPMSLLVEISDAEQKMEDRLTDLLDGAVSQAKLVSQEQDRYGRFPAMLFADGNLVQELLAREGLAVAFAAARILSKQGRGFAVGAPGGFGCTGRPVRDLRG